MEYIAVGPELTGLGGQDQSREAEWTIFEERIVDLRTVDIGIGRLQSPGKRSEYGGWKEEREMGMEMEMVMETAPEKGVGRSCHHCPGFPLVGGMSLARMMGDALLWPK